MERKFQKFDKSCEFEDSMSSDKYKKTEKNSDCSEFFFLKQSLAENKKTIQMLEKKNKILSAQKQEIQKELVTYKSSYIEITNNRENLDYEEIIKKKDLEIREIAEELQKTQQLFNEINHEYDSFTMNISNIENFNENDFENRRALKEKDEIIAEKDLALQKAQTLIKKLNEECEELSQQLFDLEKSKEDFEESQCEDFKCRISSLTQELRKSKRKYKEFKANKWEETESYANDLEKVTAEKKQLEEVVEELNKKFREVEEMSTHRLDLFCKTFEKIQEIEETLEKKQEELEMTKKKYENLEVSRQLEFISLKKSVETIFAEGKAQTKLEKVESDEEIEENSPEKSLPFAKNLKLIIRELVLQDHRLRKDIYGLIDKEADMIKATLLKMDLKCENFHADFEKWVMRNEELEQRLLQVEQNNINLLKVTADLKKILSVKDKQFEDVVKLYSRIGKEMQATIDFMSVELNDRQEYMIKDVLPTSYQYFSKSLSEAHIKIFQRTH